MAHCRETPSCLLTCCFAPGASSRVHKWQQMAGIQEKFSSQETQSREGNPCVNTTLLSPPFSAGTRAVCYLPVVTQVQFAEDQLCCGHIAVAARCAISRTYRRRIETRFGKSRCIDRSVRDATSEIRVTL